MIDEPARAPDRSYGSIQAGEEASFSRVIDAAVVATFATLTGDFNPLHMDGVYAATTQFGERVAHGMLVASYFSTLVGMYLPGRRAVFLSQDVRFAKPVRLGERITFRGRVRRKTDSLKMLDLDTWALNDAGEEVVRGRAQVMVLS
ncbi:MAG: MaoC family dehydratase [Deltaproteobacteria bacterium]|nr:MaoC family dehydratase [Deltaproteobacteria bacterium]MBI3389739.1 MaoC family dehydratase [Deltaproteobacteria bacterium]